MSDEIKKHVVVYDRLEEKYRCIPQDDMAKYHYNEVISQTTVPRLKIIVAVDSKETGEKFLDEYRNILEGNKGEKSNV